MGAHGRVHEGVLNIQIGRKDIGSVKGPMNVEFTPAFEIRHSFYIQALAGDKAMVNGELALLPAEIDGVIRAIIENKLVFQAQHQHFMSETPQVWQVHFRGNGEPVELMKRLHSVLGKTATPLNQKASCHRSSPLDHKKIGEIIGGHAEVEEDGVVSVAVKRKHRIHLGGVEVAPLLGVMSHISFKPMQDEGS